MNSTSSSPESEDQNQDHIQRKKRTSRLGKRVVATTAAVAGVTVLGVACVNAERGDNSNPSERVRAEIEQAYETITPSELVDCQVTDVRLGELVEAPAGYPEQGKQIPSIELTVAASPGERAAEFEERRSVDEGNNFVELMWRGPTLLTYNADPKNGRWPVKTFVRDENGDPYPPEANGFDYLANELPPSATSTVVLPISTENPGERTAEIREHFTINNFDSARVDDPFGESKNISQSCGQIRFQVNEDGMLEICEFIPPEEN